MDKYNIAGWINEHEFYSNDNNLSPVILSQACKIARSKLHCRTPAISPLSMLSLSLPHSQLTFFCSYHLKSQQFIHQHRGHT